MGRSVLRPYTGGGRRLGVGGVEAKPAPFKIERVRHPKAGLNLRK